MRYILLLRGINVGGKNKVSMDDLKKLLSNAGFEDVSSYINSGNLFFSSEQSQENCISKIKDLLENNYDFSIPFALISRDEYLQEKSELPDWWEEDLARKDVLFIPNHIDKLENTTVLCVSKDLPFAQARFCGAEGLSDVVTEIGRAHV